MSLDGKDPSERLFAVHFKKRARVGAGSKVSSSDHPTPRKTRSDVGDLGERFGKCYDVSHMNLGGGA